MSKAVSSTHHPLNGPSLWLLVSAALVGLWPTSALAFDVFNQDRGKAPASPPVVQPPPPVVAPVQPVKPVVPPPPQRDFILKGTMRIGNSYQAMLQSPDGKDIAQRWETGKTQVLTNYSDYALLSVAARTVVLRYPENSPCTQHQETKGVLCSKDGKTATLSLKRDKATPPKIAPPVPVPPLPVPPQVVAQPGEDPQQAAARLRAQQLFQGFQQNTIQPKDVPPGMRVVKTPFGDRLVPAQ